MAQVTTEWTVDNLTIILGWFDQCKVYRADTETGVYAEITGVGTRVNLVAPTVDYYYVDTSGGAGADKWYKVSYFNSSSSLESELSDAISPPDGLVTTITAQTVKAAYVSPGSLQAEYVSFPPRAVSFTSEGLALEGNRPYVVGTDYDLLVALLYNDEDTGLEEGIILSGCTITVTCVDVAGATVWQKTNATGVTIQSQSTKWSDGGTQGVFLLEFADTEDYTPGKYKVYCRVTYTNDEVAEQFTGDFDILTNG